MASVIQRESPGETLQCHTSLQEMCEQQQQCHHLSLSFLSYNEKGLKDKPSSTPKALSHSPQTARLP